MLQPHFDSRVPYPIANRVCRLKRHKRSQSGTCPLHECQSLPHHFPQFLRRNDGNLAAPGEQMLGDFAQPAAAKADEQSAVCAFLDRLRRVKSPARARVLSDDTATCSTTSCASSRHTPKLIAIQASRSQSSGAQPSWLLARTSLIRSRRNMIGGSSRPGIWPTRYGTAPWIRPKGRHAATAARRHSRPVIELDAAAGEDRALDRSDCLRRGDDGRAGADHAAMQAGQRIQVGIEPTAFRDRRTPL